MLLIKAIEVEDFGPFAGAQRLDVAPTDLLGVLGSVDGKPGQSNGAGKSFLVEALLFVLFGYGRTALDGLVRRGAQGCRVQVEFTDDDGEPFAVERKRGAGEGVVIAFPGADEKPPIKGAKAAELFLVQKFGASLDVFLATCFFAQGKADALVAATPSERKAYLYEILGLEVFDRADKRAGELARAADGELMRIRAEHDARQELYDEVKMVTPESVERGKLALAKLREAVAATKAELAAVEKAAGEYARVEAEVQAAAGLVPTRKRILADAEKALSDANRQRDEATLTVARLERDATDPGGVEMELKELQGKLTAQRKVLSGVREKLAAAGEKISHAQAAKDALEGVGAECPTCKQAVSAAYRTELLAVLDKNLQAAVGAERQARLALPTLEKGLREFEAREALLGKAARKAAQQAAELDAARREITAAAEAVLERSAAAETAKAEYDAAVKEARKMQVRMEGKRPPNVGAARGAWERATRQEHEQAAKVADVAGQLARAEKLAGELTALAKQRDARQEEMALWTDVREVVGKNGAPALLIDAATVDMEAAANELLARFMPEYFLTIETTRQAQSGKEIETLEFRVHEGAASRPFESFSGGERMLLNFCLRLAVAEAVAKRARRGIGFVVLDEVFGALDAANRGAVAAALRVLQSRFPQILCISHTDVADLFPRVVRIIKGGEGSRIESERAGRAQRSAGVVDRPDGAGARAAGGKAVKPAGNGSGGCAIGLHDGAKPGRAANARRGKAAGKGGRR